MKCNNCGLEFDPGDLGQVFYHEHENLNLSTEIPKSKRAISDASELYPSCSRQFACGVHTWINDGDNYDKRLLQGESEEFRRGFHQAAYELEDKYLMKR